VFLAKPENEHCHYCLTKGRRTKATIVDHRTAAKGDPVTFWDQSNWVACCETHNRRKAIQTEGALGRSATTKGTKATATNIGNNNTDTKTWG
jgi:5-methylcytosine-specific restriction endonuclease McrA